MHGSFGQVGDRKLSCHPPMVTVIFPVTHPCDNFFRRAGGAGSARRAGTASLGAEAARGARTTDGSGSALTFLTIGHRGVMGVEPENTLRSFARALGLDGATTDHPEIRRAGRFTA